MAFEHQDPTETILRLTDGVGVEPGHDAVGVDAERPSSTDREEAERMESGCASHPT